MDNSTIAHELLRQARNLAAGGENLYRVRAYRQAAVTIQGLNRPVAELVAVAGPRGLRGLPGVGASLAKTIAALAAGRSLAKAG